MCTSNLSDCHCFVSAVVTGALNGMCMCMIALAPLQYRPAAAVNWPKSKEAVSMLCTCSYTLLASTLVN